MDVGRTSDTWVENSEETLELLEVATEISYVDKSANRNQINLEHNLNLLYCYVILNSKNDHNKFPSYRKKIVELAERKEPYIFSSYILNFFKHLNGGRKVDIKLMGKTNQQNYKEFDQFIKNNFATD